MVMNMLYAVKNNQKRKKIVLSVTYFSFLISGIMLVHPAFSQEKEKLVPKLEEVLPDMDTLSGTGGWTNSVSRSAITPEDMKRIKADNNPLLPTTEHLFGSWGGVRTWLYKHGLSFSLDDKNEFAGNITGGVRKGATNAGAVDANLDVDWSTLVGKNWVTDGLVSHMTVIGRYGNDLGKTTGENINQVQEIYGASGNVAAKLIQLYTDKRFLNSRIVWTFGRMAVGAHYASSPLHCNFMNNGICGNPKALVGQVGGFNAWPDASWGTNLMVRPIPKVYVRVGLYQVSRAAYGNAAGHRAGWAGLVKTSRDAGGEIPIEVGFEPKWGKDELPGHYKFGFAYDTSPYQVWGKDIYGGHVATSGQPQKWHRGRDTEWVMLDQMILRNGPSDASGLIGLVGWIHSNPLTFQRKDEIIAGLINTGFWKSRPQDAIGLLFIHQTMSGKLKRAQRYYLSQTGLSGGFPGGALRPGLQTAEDTFELTYIIRLYEGVRFQPDFQYEIHPNAQKNINDAAFLGFKSQVEF